jgi:two-component system, LuxR family, response regulator FixJ
LKKTLLFVEDDDDARDLLGRALLRAGYTCVLASSAKQALEQLEATPYIDLVIADIVLGSDDHGGLHLIGQLRARGVMAPVILITAFADVEKLKFGLNQGASHLLEKPFRAVELLDVVEALLEHKPSSRGVTERALRSVPLTGKELTVARHLLAGLSSTEIAEMELNSAKTIRQHVSRIYAKFGVSSRADFFRLVYSGSSSAE